MRILTLICLLERQYKQRGNVECSVFIPKQNPTIAKINKITSMSNSEGHFTGLLLHHTIEIEKVNK